MINKIENLEMGSVLIGVRCTTHTYVPTHPSVIRNHQLLSTTGASLIMAPTQETSWIFLKLKH